MKIIISIFICVLLGQSMFFVEKSSAEWEHDLVLTNEGTISSYNNAWCIAANENVVHVVWYSIRDGNYEIYYKRSTNSGLTWSANSRLTNNIEPSSYPSIAVSGLLVHIIWDEERNGNFEIYYKRSTDAGISWGTETYLTNQTVFRSEEHKSELQSR